MKADTLVYADTLADIQAESLRDTLVDVKAKAVVDALAD